MWGQSWYENLLANTEFECHTPCCVVYTHAFFYGLNKLQLHPAELASITLRKHSYSIMKIEEMEKESESQPYGNRTVA